MEYRLSVVAAIGVVAFAAGGIAAFGQPAAAPTLVISAYNYAAVPENVLLAARTRVDDIYRAAGVDIQWRALLADGSSQSEATSAVPAAAFTVRMLIRPRQAAWDPSRKATMGMALASDDRTGVVLLFFDAVMKVAMKSRQSVADILGIAMAHEIGHVLLPPPSHAPTGIMRGAWDGWNVDQALMGPLTFTAVQEALIRQRLAQCCDAPGRP